MVALQSRPLLGHGHGGIAGERTVDLQIVHATDHVVDHDGYRNCGSAGKDRIAGISTTGQPKNSQSCESQNKAKNLRMLFSLLVMGSFQDHGLANCQDTRYDPRFSNEKRH